MKRGASGLSGVLAIDKPSGITSHDVVNRVRALTGEKRVGHAGTLDPLACGLLLVCVGPATRLAPYLTGHDKCYEARIVFGAATDTDDCEGRVVTSYTGREPGEGLASLSTLDPVQVLDALPGTFQQLPPAYSAIKKNGVTAYKAAREGRAIELDPREVTVYEATLLGTGVVHCDLAWDEQRFCAELPYWDVHLRVSKGTYIRSIARDLGQQLGCGAHLGALRRTAVGALGAENACTLEELGARHDADEALPWADPVKLLGLDGGVRFVSERGAEAVACGRALDNPKTCHADAHAAPRQWAVVHGERLLAVYGQDGARLKPLTVIPGGVAGVRNSGHLGADASPVPSENVRVDWNPLEGFGQPLGTRVLAFGVFDGLHAGHRSLLNAARADADAKGVPFSIVTFANDPDAVLGAEPGRFKLMSDDTRLRLLGSLVRKAKLPGEVLVIHTTRETLGMQPDAFLRVLGEVCTPAALHVGCGFRFGAKAAGTVDDLRLWCEQHNAVCTAHALLECEGAPVSATRIRGVLAAGHIAEARRLGLLCYRVDGVVEHGRGEGTGFGFATANVQPDDDGVMLPGEGVYAGCAAVGGETYPAAVNVGAAKSFKDATAPLEVHLLGFKGDLYGKRVSVMFNSRLRSQRVFETHEELIETVSADIAWVREHADELLSGALDGDGER